MGKWILLFLSLAGIVPSIQAPAQWSWPAIRREEVAPLLCLKGGKYFAGSHHTGGFFEVEYKSGKKWYGIRPQIGATTPQFHSLLIYGGVALDLYFTEHFVVTPSFSPGIYFQGKGRNLGYPLEFRSCIELAHEFINQGRFGIQFFHVSNASLGCKNPGANAFAFFIGLPL